MKLRKFSPTSDSPSVMKCTSKSFNYTKAFDINIWVICHFRLRTSSETNVVEGTDPFYIVSYHKKGQDFLDVQYGTFGQARYAVCISSSISEQFISFRPDKKSNYVFFVLFVFFFVIVKSRDWYKKRLLVETSEGIFPPT